MKIIVIVLLMVILSLSSTPIALAQMKAVLSQEQNSSVNSKITPYLSNQPFPLPSPIEYDLPFAGILPDHPLYFFKFLRDKFLLFFTRDPIKKIQYLVLFSDKHLVMGQMLLERGNREKGYQTLNRGETYFLTAVSELQKFSESKNLPPGLVDKVKTAGRKHEEVLINLREKMKDSTQKEAIGNVVRITNQANSVVASIK